jgi:hypothetical protein
VELTYADFEALNAFRSRVVELEAAEKTRQSEIARAQEQHLIEKGRFEEAIKVRDERLAREVSERDTRIAHLDRTFKSTLLEKELATALSSFPLVPGAAKQLTALLRDEFEVAESNGQFRVQTRTLEAVSDFLRDQLTGPEYEHFLKPSGSPGSGARGGAQTPPNHRANPTPSSPDDEVFARWQATQSRLAEQGFAARGLKGLPIK